MQAIVVDQRVRDRGVIYGQVTWLQDRFPVALDSNARSGQLQADEDARLKVVSGEARRAPHGHRVPPDRGYGHPAEIGDRTVHRNLVSPRMVIELDTDEAPPDQVPDRIGPLSGHDGLCIDDRGH
jgi:hypothetical protein